MTLHGWLIAVHEGGFDFLRAQLARHQLPLDAALLERIPEGIDELVVAEGEVKHYENCMETGKPGEIITMNRVRYFVLTKNGLLADYIGQRVKVVWRRGAPRLIVEVIR